MSGEFSAVAAPANQNPNSSVAFAAALERAKQIAAKINPGGCEPGKRSLDENSEFPEAKKLAVSGVGIGGSTANNVEKAAAVAARVAAAAAAGIQGVGVPGMPLGPVSSKDIKVPDRMVGLIIGRGGEQITRLQAESGCKIQMAPDSGGMPERMCTLTGNAQAIGRAEDMIAQIVNSRAREVMAMNAGSDMGSGSYNNSNDGGGGGGPSNIPNRMNNAQKSMTPNISNPSYTQVEIMVPGPKVGLIIGKGGEMIKQLQEKSGAKMIIIQEGPTSQEIEKPLRISGEPHKVEHAKSLVYEIMAEKDAYMSQQQQRRGGGGPSGGRGGPGGGGGYNSGYGGGGGGGHRQQQWDADQLETTIIIPAGRCGVVIGKGGETIRQINQQTGAFCEIDRKQSSTATEKVFIVRGTIDQIENVKRLFSEKLNMNVQSGPISGSNGPMNNGSGYGGAGPANGGGPQGYGGGQWNNAPQQYQQPSPQQQQQQWNHSQQPQPQQQPVANAGGPGGGLGAGGSVPVNPLTGAPDYSAQWIDYYRSMGMHREAALVEEQAKKVLSTGQHGQQQVQGMQPQMAQVQQAGGQAIAMQQQQQMAAAAGAQQQVGGAVAADQSGANQPDYSVQWAAYYRSIGKIKDAEAIEAQMKQKGLQQPAQVQQAVASGGQTVSAGGMYNAQSAGVYGGMGAYQASNANTAAGGYYGAAQQQTGAPSATQYPGY